MLEGTFSKDVPLNSTFTARGMYDHNPPGLVFVKDFCYPVYSLDQPDMNRTRECPPEKGWALMIFEGFTSPWDLPPVSPRQTRRKWSTNSSV